MYKGEPSCKNAALLIGHVGLCEHCQAHNADVPFDTSLRANRRVAAGEELAYSYGLAYWETFADQILDIEYSEKQEKEIQRLTTEVGALHQRLLARSTTMDRLQIEMQQLRKAAKKNLAKTAEIANPGGAQQVISCNWIKLRAIYNIIYDNMTILTK